METGRRIHVNFLGAERKVTILRNRALESEMRVGRRGGRGRECGSSEFGRGYMGKPDGPSLSLLRRGPLAESEERMTLPKKGFTTKRE